MHLKINEAHLLDYMNCPALYDMKYNKRMPASETISLSALLKKVSDYFYLHLLNGKILGLSDLKSKWDSISESHKLNPKQVLEGFAEINKFANWMGHEQPIVLDVKTPYTVVIGKTETSGILNPVFKHKNGEEIVITDFSSRLPDQRLVDMKLKYTLDAYAYKQLFKRDLVGIRIHNVKHNKDIYTYRTEHDYDRLISTVSGASESIRNNFFYARDSFMCASCPMLTYCRYWTTRDT